MDRCARMNWERTLTYNRRNNLLCEVDYALRGSYFGGGPAF